jgi:hypothetical protein
MQECSASENLTNRLPKGKAAEARIAAAVIAAGIPLQPVTEQEDMIAKVDRKVEWTAELQAKFPTLDLPIGTLYVQIKTRETGTDLLLDAYEPFHGLKNDQTKEGRDFVGKYEIYICGTEQNIVIANAREVKTAAMKTIVRYGCDFEGTRQAYRRWYYRDQPTSLCIMEDHCNGRQKMIVFVQPSVVTRKHLLTSPK